MVADAPALMDRLHDATAFARRPAVLAPLLALCAALLVHEALDFGELADATGRLFEQPVALVAVGCVLWLSLALHELAHGVVARAYGLHVTEIALRRFAGFMTYLYCEVEDVQFLGRRGPQVAVALAGVVANLAFLLPFWLVWALLPGGAQAVPFFGGLLLLGTATGLANLLPLPPLDGYKALGYALGTLRLATESRVFARLALAAAARRPEAARKAAAYPRRLRRVLAAYALLCALLAAAALAGLCLLSRAALPDGAAGWSPYLPLAVLAAALPLRTLGLRAAARRTARTPAAAAPQATAAPAHTAGAAAVPVPPAGPAARPPAAPPHETAPEALMEQAAPRPQETAVVVEGVRKRYGEVRALDGVSFEVGRGEFFGVLGPNGAGKTTLVEIVEGMRQADEGSVRVLGENPWPRNLTLLRRIGVQTQTSAFFTRLTAAEHLETVAALQGLDRSAASRAIEAVGLTDKARSRVDDLSGGQRQRLALATALVHDPELIFLDEPTAALDPEARRSLWGLLRELRGQGRTIVYTTHYLDEAEALCDRVAIIAGGRLAALDTPGALIRSMAAPARLLVPADRITPDRARAIEGVERVLVEGGEVVIETRAANRVLIALSSLVDLDAIQTRTATLEDAYLRLTAAGSEHG
jgi:ABC-type multidrug transport system ATPase subunit